MAWVALAVVGALVCWGAVSVLLASLSGWSSLAEKYSASTLRLPPFKTTGGRVGEVTYGGMLRVGAQSDGLALSVLPLFRLGHKPLFIPWDDVTESSGEFMGQSTTVFRIRGLPDAAIELPRAVGAELRVKQ